MKMLLGSARMDRMGRLVFRNESMMKSCRPEAESVREPKMFHMRP